MNGWPKRIVLMRHGQSEGNIVPLGDSSLTGKANHTFSLTPTGREQAQNIGKYLRERYGHFDTYFCSTFRRTQETLTHVYPDAVPIIDSRLNELFRGVWYTLPREQIDTLYPGEAQVKKQEGGYHYRPLGGESCPDVEGRIHSFLHTLRIDYADKNLLISTHCNWMLLFWRIILNKMPEDFERRYENNKYNNCAIAIYEGSSLGLQLVLEA